MPTNMMILSEVSAAASAQPSAASIQAKAKAKSELGPLSSTPCVDKLI
jgi:hypothetical protein